MNWIWYELYFSLAAPSTENTPAPMDVDDEGKPSDDKKVRKDNSVKLIRLQKMLYMAPPHEVKYCGIDQWPLNELNFN